LSYIVSGKGCKKLSNADVKRDDDDNDC
jgi:hypothetical protein